MKIQYFNRDTGKMEFVELPDNVDSIGIDIEQAGLIVEVNTDAVQVFQLGRRISMHDFDELTAEAAMER